MNPDWWEGLFRPRSQAADLRGEDYEQDRFEKAARTAIEILPEYIPGTSEIDLRLYALGEVEA